MVILLSIWVHNVWNFLVLVLVLRLLTLYSASDTAVLWVLSEGSLPSGNGTDTLSQTILISAWALIL